MVQPWVFSVLSRELKVAIHWNRPGMRERKGREEITIPLHFCVKYWLNCEKLWGCFEHIPTPFIDLDCTISKDNLSLEIMLIWLNITPWPIQGGNRFIWNPHWWKILKSTVREGPTLSLSRRWVEPAAAASLQAIRWKLACDGHCCLAESLRSLL